MSIVEKITSRKKALWVGAVAVAICVVTAVIYPAAASTPKGGENQQAYKETPVTIGDVTVGINESGTASLESIAVTYDDYSSVTSSDDTANLKALVEEVYVKAGQKVKVGDPIAKISTDEIQESLDTLQQDRKAAQIALDKAKLEQQSGLLTAQNTLETRLNNAENADLNYELSLDQSNGNLSNLKVAMENAGEKADLAEDALDDFNNMRSDYNDRIAQLRQEISDADGRGEDTSALQSQLASVLADYDDFERNYNDLRKSAYAAYSAAANEYDSAKLKYEIASNSLSLDEKTAETERTEALSYKDNAQLLYDLEVGQLENSVASKSLTLENLDKKIAKLQSYLTDGQVKATCEGLVMNVYVVAGDKVSANATLATISNSQNIYMTVAIDQEDIASLELGKASNIILDAYPDKKLTGKVDSISVTPAMGGSSTVSYSVKVKLDSDDESIYEGMTGSVIFVTEQVTNVLTVSSKAVYTQDGKTYVKIKDASGNITPVEVETGFTNGTLTEIKSGLREGDIAIIESKVNAK